MSYEPVQFHSYQKIKPRANFEFAIFIVSSINDRCTFKKLKIIKGNSSVCCIFGMEWIRASLTMSGVGVFARVRANIGQFEQLL